MGKIASFELTQEYLDSILEAIENQHADFIRESLDSVRHEDISALLEEFNAEQSKYVLELLEKEVASDVIEDLDEDTRVKFLSIFSPEEISEFIEEIETDDAADILMDLPVKVREEVIANIQNPEKSMNIIELLRYDEDCAGGLMAKELIKANHNWNVVQCIEEIRRQAEYVQKIYSVYVVDDQNKLLGRVSLKDIVLAKSSTKIADIYSEKIISVYTYQKEEEIADLMQKYDLESAPVINVQGKLVGRITVDDIIDVITELADQERNLMAGISEDVEVNDSVWMLSRARLPWLVIGLIGGLVGARFIGVFQKDLEQVASLAFFIPLIIATGGNVGIQSSALVVQSLASVSIFESSIWQKLIKTLLVAMLNGIILAGLVYIFVFFLYGPKLSFVVGVALFTVVMLASTLGTFIPIFLNKVGFNPALASGPFITTTIDLIGLAVYFTVAHILYSF